MQSAESAPNPRGAPPPLPRRPTRSQPTGGRRGGDGLDRHGAARSGGSGGKRDRARRQALQGAVFDGSHPNSLRANVQRLHRTGAGVRDRLSLDMWRVITQLDRQCEPSSARSRVDTAMLLRLDDLITTLAAWPVWSRKA